MRNDRLLDPGRTRTLPASFSDMVNGRSLTLANEVLMLSGEIGSERLATPVVALPNLALDVGTAVSDLRRADRAKRRHAARRCQASDTRSAKSSLHVSSVPSGRRMTLSGLRARTAPSSWVTSTIAPA
jgi:hypothetical protein